MSRRQEVGTQDASYEVPERTSPSLLTPLCLTFRLPRIHFVLPKTFTWNKTHNFEVIVYAKTFSRYQMRTLGVLLLALAPSTIKVVVDVYMVTVDGRRPFAQVLRN